MIPQGLQIAKRFDDISGSAIREIFKVLALPNMISFAGGNPSADALPNELCAELAKEVLLADGKRILQYGATEGYPPFLESLTDYLTQMFSPYAATMSPIQKNQILPITGSTQGMDLLCKTFLNPGDAILTESPTFLGNVQSLRLYQSNLIPVESDDNGLMLDKLEAAIQKHHPKLLYTIPTFQNPSGKTLAADRREPIARMAEKYGFLIVEDDPYRDLRYTGEALPPIKAYDRSGHVAYMGSFSKLISPGLRVGYLIAQEDILRTCTIGKQSSDLQTPGLTQAIIDQYLRRNLLTPHIQANLGPYREKMNLMLTELESFPKSISYTRPEGGLFIFVTLPEHINATKLFPEAVARGVAYVPGTYFYPEGGHDNTFRLNFSNSTPAQISKGMGILRDLFKEKLNT